MTRHDCAQLAEDLVAYADGELDSARAREVKQELESCATCQRELDALQRSWAALDSLAAGDLQPLSAARFDAIEAQIRAQAGSPAAAPAKAGLLVRFPWLAPVVAAAGVLLVAGLGWSVLNTPDEFTAVRPDQPAPKVPRTQAPQVGIDETPVQETPKHTPKPGQRDSVPEAPVSPPDAPEPPPEAPPTQPDPLPPVAPPEAPDTAPDVTPDTGPVIAEADFDSLSPDEQEFVENLELAMLLDDEGLEDMSTEELEAELLLNDIQDDLEGWDLDELDAG